MPILHVQYDGQAQATDGSIVKVPPADVLSRQGPLVQVVISIGKFFSEQLAQQGHELPSPVTGVALIDTGATTTCIDDSIALQMGMPAVDVVMMASASHAATRQNVYSVHMEIVGSPIRVEVPKAMGASLKGQGIIALIGRDYLRHCTLYYNGIMGEITLAI
jgi:predicted aspartyl protease